MRKQREAMIRPHDLSFFRYEPCGLFFILLRFFALFGFLDRFASARFTHNVHLLSTKKQLVDMMERSPGYVNQIVAKKACITPLRRYAVGFCR